MRTAKPLRRGRAHLYPAIVAPSCGGAAAALIELGFLLAYRAGWKISVAAVATNAAAAITLIPIGVLIFKDHLSLRNIAGLVLCVLGLAMIMRD